MLNCKTLYRCNYKTKWKVIGKKDYYTYTYNRNAFPIGYKCFMKNSFGYKFLVECVANTQLYSTIERYKDFYDENIIRILKN